MSQSVILSFHRRLGIPIFQWVGRFYSALTLQWVLLEANDELEFITNFWPGRSNKYTRQLALIETVEAWVLFSTQNNELILESETHSLVPQKLSELRITNAYFLKFPEVDLLEHQIYKKLPSREITPFNVNIASLISQAILSSSLLTDIGVEIIIVTPDSLNILAPRSRPFIINPSNYSTFQERPPELPQFIIIHGLKVNFISFPDIGDMLSQNKIERYIIDPSLQYLIENSNTIFTFFGKNGITYLVKGRYDPQTNQIFPPV